MAKNKINLNDSVSEQMTFAVVEARTSSVGNGVPMM